MKIRNLAILIVLVIYVKTLYCEETIAKTWVVDDINRVIVSTQTGLGLTGIPITGAVSVKIDGSSNTVRVTGVVSVISTDVVNAVGTLTSIVNSTINVVNATYSNLSSTYQVITAYASGSTATTFSVDNYSAVSLGGDNSFRINSLPNIPVYDSSIYNSPTKQKVYTNPTINYTMTTGTLTIVLEGYK